MQWQKEEEGEEDKILIVPAAPLSPLWSPVRAQLLEPCWGCTGSDSRPPNRGAIGVG